jgi:hypothetical protein
MFTTSATVRLPKEPGAGRPVGDVSEAMEVNDMPNTSDGIILLAIERFSSPIPRFPDSSGTFREILYELHVCLKSLGLDARWVTFRKLWKLMICPIHRMRLEDRLARHCKHAART